MQDHFDINKALSLRKAAPEEMTRCRNSLLQAHLRQAVKTPFYKNLFSRIDCRPEEINLENLNALPLTTRQDVEADPAAFFATPPEIQVDLALTSGSTGAPVLVPYTARDLERLAFNEQMNFYGAGIRNDDRLLLCVTLDRCFVAGLAYYTGLVRLGASCIRSGPGQAARQWELIDRLRPTGLIGVPSFLLKMAQWGKSHGYNPGKSGIRTLITIGEPVRRADNSLTPLGRELEEAWQGRIFSSYGATELETAFCECTASGGGHIHPELMIAEIVDEAGKPVKTGEPGEVVVTPLGVEGFPLIRFRTGDIARLHTSPCQCGWQTPRLGAIEGRLAQRLKVKGTTLYPEMIFQALQELPEIHASYLEVRADYDLSDRINIVIGVDDSSTVHPELISDHLQARLRVKPEITVQARKLVQETMEQSGGRKLKRFFDLRGE
ncbi:MAG: AMP-binding protein [Desulfobulbaceae bacterium]|nr:AMP-binding protein [Desulfobulbaceae bacterium]